MENTNPQGEVSDPIAAIAGILEREEQQDAPDVEAQEQEQEAPEVEAESAETDAAQEGQAEDDGYEDVEYEGNAYKLPKELKEALLRQSDYTKKTQEVAETRRLVEAQQEAVKAQEMAFRAEVAFQQTSMQDIAEIQAAQNIVKQYEAVDWQSLSDSDPVKAQSLWFQYQQQKDKITSLQQGLQAKHQQFQQQQQQHLAAQMQKGLEALKKDIPNWSPETAKEIREAGMKYYGFQSAELANVYDPRFVKVLADAAAYRKLQAAKPDLNKRVATVPKTVKPGAQQTNQARKQEASKESFARLKKTGKVDDAARAIAHLM